MIVIITIVSCAELRKKRVNIFMLNLAVGDLVVGVVSTPLLVVTEVVGHWMFGNFACKVLVFGHMSAVAFTIFLLTAVSIDRYQVSFITLISRRVNAGKVCYCMTFPSYLFFVKWRKHQYTKLVNVW